MTTEYRMAGDKVGANESIAEAIALLERVAAQRALGEGYGVARVSASNRGLDAQSVSFGERALALARQFGSVD